MIEAVKLWDNGYLMVCKNMLDTDQLFGLINSLWIAIKEIITNLVVI